MSRRGVGFGFCAIAAALYAVNYLAAFLWMPHMTSWDTGLGRLGAAYQEVGQILTHAAILSLCVGVVYLLLAEWQAARPAAQPEPSASGEREPPGTPV